MKILFDHPGPFMLAHGGFQIQIEETKRALESLGVEVEFLRWWDSHQRGDLIHYFGRPSGAYVDLAQQKNVRVVMAELLTGLGSRSPAALVAQRLLIQLARRGVPQALRAKMGWEAYVKADRIIALTEWEAELARRIFHAPAERVIVIPNGVAPEFLSRLEPEAERGSHLICTATITERKRILELAQAAVFAKTPLWIIGKAYAEKDPYFQHFLAVAQRNPQVIRYDGAIDDSHLLAEAYRQARGFVLLSSKESLSLSALEAAACGCPLLLSDLPWARTVFKKDATYCPVTGPSRTARTLRAFYDAAPGLKPTLKPLLWGGVALQLKKVYASLLGTSR
jgi:glycosyltransferase involved in cell wall biosynthesis